MTTRMYWFSSRSNSNFTLHQSRSLVIFSCKGMRVSKAFTLYYYIIVFCLGSNVSLTQPVYLSWHIPGREEEKDREGLIC